MSTPKDTINRLLTLVQLIPHQPKRISTTSLYEKLSARGHHIDARTLQRDLERLSHAFPVLCDDTEKPYQWSLNANLKLQDLDTPAALTLYMAEAQVRSLLPQSVIDELQPLFSAARQQLNNLQHNKLANWADRVRTIPNGKTLLAAEIKPSVWQQVTEALLSNQHLQVNYLSRTKGENKQLQLHPIALVARTTITYLIATVGDYSDPRHFALHRIDSAQCLETPAQQPPDFNLDTYIANGAFALRQHPETVELIADIHPQQAWLLTETPLSLHQQLTSLPDSDWFRLTATVPLEQETLWWIFGLNNRIRVYAPQVWVEQIREAVADMQNFYQQTSDARCRRGLL